MTPARRGSGRVFAARAGGRYVHAVPHDVPRGRSAPTQRASAEGCAQAIRTLGPPVLRYLRAILRDEDDANDAFSAWAESVWRGLPRFRGESSLRTWGFRLAYRAALGVRDRPWRRRERRLATSEASRLAETLRTSTGLRRERQRRVLHELRRQLTMEDQSLVQLRVDEGLSWGAIAEVLARHGAAPDPATVAKRFERLKARLATLLRREGLTP